MTAFTQELFNRFPELRVCKDDINKSFSIIKECYENKGKVLICGNGGSCADAEHIVGELMKGFRLKRKIDQEKRAKLLKHYPESGTYLADHLQGALPAISLNSHAALSSAFINDVASDMVYAQQVFGYGNEVDVLIGISTSGNALNVINAVKVANSFGLKTIGFTGRTGGKLKDLCNVSIKVPSAQTYKIQEYHLPIYHTLCLMIESYFFKD